jgi:hypothetical protein
LFIKGDAYVFILVEQAWWEEWDLKIHARTEEMLLFSVLGSSSPIWFPLAFSVLID